MKVEAGIVATVQAQGKNWKSPHVRWIVLSSVGWWRCFFCEFLGKLGKEDPHSIDPLCSNLTWQWKITMFQ